LYILGAIYIKVLFRRTIFSIVTMLASYSVTKTAKPSTIKPEYYPVLILSASSYSMYCPDGSGEHEIIVCCTQTAKQ